MIRNQIRANLRLDDRPMVALRLNMSMFNEITKIPVIDSHVHVFPPKIFTAVQTWFETFAWGFHGNGMLDERIQYQFERGVAGLVFMSYAHKPGIALQLNEFTSKLVKRFPHTVGLAAVHPHDPDYRDILNRAFQEQGLCGLKLHCHVMKMAPDDPSLFPVYEVLTSLGGVLNIHAGREPASDAYGMDVRTITGAERVINILERFPELRVIVPHFGWDEEDIFFSLLATYPNLFLDTTMLLADFFEARIAPDKINLHADRILYGTDYPHIPYPVETELKAICGIGLKESNLRRILLENALKLYPINPRLV